jgi:hypothetical protein
MALSLVGTVSGQQGSLEVRSPAAKLLDASPGQIVTTSVVVANRSAEDDEIVETLMLPKGCQRVAPAAVPFRLPPGGQTVRVLAIAVPAGMPAGQFPVLYQVRSRRDPSSISSLDLRLQVTAVDLMDLVVAARPEPVLAGDRYTIEVTAQNHGNCALAAELNARSSLELPLVLETTSFVLESGSSRTVTCLVETPRNWTRHTSHAVTFDLKAKSQSGSELTASQAAVSEIIPQTMTTTDPYHRLPIQQRLIAFGGTGQEGQVQVEFSGSGSLDEAGQHQVDFLLRGPDAGGNNLFGERDEYGVSYHSAHWDIDLGDRIYRLSPLTERHSLGRGAGITWHGQNVTVGGFYMTTRFRRHNVEELGFFARYDFSDDFSLQGNFLRKTGGDPAMRNALPQNLMTVEARYRRGRVLSLQAEAGFSEADRGGGDVAARVAADGEIFGIKYSIEAIHAGAEFYGYFQNTDTLYSSFARQITDRLRAHGSFNRYSGNLELSDIRTTVVTEEMTWNAGANYRLNEATELTLDWLHTRRRDILPPAAFDFTEDSLRAGITHRAGKLQTQAAVHLGVLDNAVTGENSTFQRITASLNWQATDRHSYSIYGSYGPNAFTGSTHRAFEAGATANWNFSDQLTATLSYAFNQFDGLVGSEQNQLLASLRYQFKNKSSLAIIARVSKALTKSAATSATDMSAVFVTYTMPFDVPVGRKRSIGGIRGRLRDDSVPGGRAIARVVLQVGEQLAVTDENGEFHFPQLQPGTHQLQVRQDSLGPHLALTTPMPMTVKVSPADTTPVELLAMPACSLTIKATRDGAAPGQAQEGVVVEISNGVEVWRAQTDRRGHAAFDRLSPGTWRVRLAAEELPPLHSIDQPDRTLTLIAGEQEQVTARIVAQRRTLRMVDGGAIR